MAPEEMWAPALSSVILGSHSPWGLPLGSSEVMLFPALAQASSSKCTMKEIQLTFSTVHSGSRSFRGSPNMMQPAGRLEDSVALQKPPAALVFLEQAVLGLWLHLCSEIALWALCLFRVPLNARTSCPD